MGGFFDSGAGKLIHGAWPRLDQQAQYGWSLSVKLWASNLLLLQFKNCILNSVV